MEAEGSLTSFSLINECTESRSDRCSHFILDLFTSSMPPIDVREGSCLVKCFFGVIISAGFVHVYIYNSNTFPSLFSHGARRKALSREERRRQTFQLLNK